MLPSATVPFCHAVVNKERRERKEALAVGCGEQNSSFMRISGLRRSRRFPGYYFRRAEQEAGARVSLEGEGRDEWASAAHPAR